MMEFYKINQKQYLESVNLNKGSFYPVTNFMNKLEIDSVSKYMRLPNKKIFPIPIFFDVSKEDTNKFEKKKVFLIYNKKKVGYFKPTEIYKCNKKRIAKSIFGTLSNSHPGVKAFLDSKKYFVAGKVKINKNKEIYFNNLDFNPEQTKKYFKKKKWKTIVGFQTRNIPHDGHEFIHKKILEKYDAIFINPLVGEKQKGDFTKEAVVKSYNILINSFYPKNKTFFGLLTTNMRYAGPREAIFHAIIRKNFGCTHFIVGRDHAGVGNFYKEYESHNLVNKLGNNIGIKIIKFMGPFFCKKCEKVTNKQYCNHYKNKKNIIDISGTNIRKKLKQGKFDNCRFVQKKVLSSLKKIKLFL